MKVLACDTVSLTVNKEYHFQALVYSLMSTTFCKPYKPIKITRIPLIYHKTSCI